MVYLAINGPLRQLQRTRWAGIVCIRLEALDWNCVPRPDKVKNIFDVDLKKVLRSKAAGAMNKVLNEVVEQAAHLE
ncbi:hypothetical protein Q0P45_14015, partial [Staphylococcus aureus]|nr:hypothetical protein [Staphylococcus aureus]